MWIWLLASVVGISWLIWEAKNAPEGYEDETGFHYGVDPKDQAALDRMNKE